MNHEVIKFIRNELQQVGRMKDSKTDPWKLGFMYALRQVLVVAQNESLDHDCRVVQEILDEEDVYDDNEDLRIRLAWASGCIEEERKKRAKLESYIYHEVGQIADEISQHCDVKAVQMIDAFAQEVFKDIEEDRY